MSAALAGAAAAACALAVAAVDAAAGPPARPADCRSVAAGGDTAAVLAAVPEGAAVCLEPGDHAGPLRIDRRITVWGPREAVVHSQGGGSTVAIDADGANLLGITVDGSGGRFDLLDAAVRIHADGVRVEGIAVRRALFGVLAEQARGLEILRNDVEGDPDKALGLRGDGIRLWEVRDSRIEGNRVRDSRDLVVWYSPGNRFVDNRVEGSRYGTHFMYSHGNVVQQSVYRRNVVGVFAMYSRDLVIRGNLVAESGGAAGVGLGSKESGNLRVDDNWFLGNTVGVYLDTSPLYPDQVNRFEGNVLRYSNAAVVFHGGADRNRFTGNWFLDNEVQVRMEGRGDARAALWRGNTWDDYRGYDLDGDGVGDVAYAVRSLSSEWTARQPSLAWFRGTVAMGLVDLVGRAVPLFAPTTVLEDPAPRLGRRPPRWSDAH